MAFRSYITTFQQFPYFSDERHMTITFYLLTDLMLIEHNRKCMTKDGQVQKVEKYGYLDSYWHNEKMKPQ